MKKFSMGLAAAVLAAGTGLAGTFTAGNLAVFSADNASTNNTTLTIIELDPSTANQTVPVSSTAIGGTGTNALRTSGSATSTGYLSRNDDRSLLVFTAHNNTNVSGNANTFLLRGVGTLDVNQNFVLQTTYTGLSGNQTRGATSTNSTKWYVGDQGGIYTNGATSAFIAGNWRSLKSFGGTIYAFAASASLAPVSTISGNTATALPGLPIGSTAMQDFYMLSSGSNGSNFDILYILNSAGTIYKYSLVSGSWTTNGTYSSASSGFGLCAAKSGGGAVLYITSGSGATAANSVQKLTDSAGYNTAMSSGAATTLYTAPAPATMKGIDFAPAKPTTQANNIAFSSVQQTQMDVSWTSGDGVNRLVICRQGSAPDSGPVDGTTYTADANFAGGGSALGGGKVVFKGSGSSFTLSGLTANTTYYLQVYEFNGSGTTAMYLTDAATGNPNNQTTPAVAGDTDSTAVAPGAQVLAGDVASLATSAGSAVDVFACRLQDPGTADGYATKVTQLTVKSASGNTAGWAASIQGVKLYNVSDAAAVTIGTPTITDAAIVIPIASGDLNIPNGTSKDIRLSVYLKTSAIVDNQMLQFKIDSAAPGFLTDPTASSSFAATFPADVTGNAMTIRVTATKLALTAVPSSVRINQNFSVTVQAQDANNNVDLDSTAAVEISKATGSGTLTGGSAQSLVTGSKTFDALQFDTAGTNTLQAAGGGLSNATSGVIIVLPPFTAGNLVVERMEGLSNSGTVVSCVEYDTSGTLQQTITLPNATNRPSANPFNLMDSGSATSNGQLTRSADGTKIVMPGYNGTNNEASIAGSSAATVSRTIGVLGTDGTVDTSRSYNMLSGDNFRSVASTDGTVFWAAGAGGVVYVNAAGTLATLSTTNTRCINIFNNQLYFSTGSGTVGIYSLGSGLPTSGSPTPTLLFSLNSGNGSPYAFAINSDSTMAYVGDTAGIYKYTYSADAWSYQYTLNTGFKSTSLTVDFSGPSPVIYATAGNTGGNSLVTITDTGSGSSATTLATAGAGQVFRGVAFAPQNPGPAITITNPATSSAPVPYATNTYSIAGTSSNAVGSLLWTNTLTSSNGTLAAGATWSVADIALDVGANAITVSGTNASGTAASATVTITRQPASLDGGGTAVLKNAGTDALTNSVIFCRGQSGQTAALTVTGAVWHTLKAVAVDLPAFFTGLDSNNVSLAGTGFPTGATWSVAGQTLTVTNAALTDTQPGVITIGGLTTGTPALTNDTSEQTWMVRTAEDSDLTAIASSPKAYITLPLAMLRGVDASGVPVRSNQTVAVEGTCIVSNGTFSTSQLTAYIQDGAAGVCLFQSGGGTWPVPIHHRIVAKGLVAQRNGLTEVVPVSSADLYDLGAATPVTPVVATFSALLADAENYESTLVTVKNITFTGTWPAPGADANLAANDGTSNLTLSIDKDTNIDGTPAPTQPLTATGIFNQNDTTSPPYDSGYQLIPRSTADLTLLPVFLGGGITVDPSTGQPSLTFVTTNSIFGTTNGFQYRIVYKDDLLSTNKWLPVTDPDPGWTNSASGTITIQDPGAAGSTQRFYRIEAQ